MGDPSGYELPGFLSVHTALQDPMLEERHLFFGIWFNCSGEELFCYPQLISSQHRRNHESIVAGINQELGPHCTRYYIHIK
ncbi:hypothetical protein Y1Q_0000539 [Alligator mississippiensis]|uniref:Uncharacterized protein n=1 Tax=Alligator mississippiensis TaxID=8496 RepID=A0A151MBS1_ALLMI|nr:hypothetical protein Y1Q_0000539 [Alligator mississippiensis]